VAAAKVALPGLTPVAARPESEVIVPVPFGTVDGSLGSIPSGTNVPAKTFARSSLRFLLRIAIRAATLTRGRATIRALRLRPRMYYDSRAR
jgi:hypothetical protein